MTVKLIIDTDPGVDDAMAILMALRSPELEIVGLTSVFGNAPGPIAAQNALRLVELEGNGHIPVAKGCEQPMASIKPEFGTMVHGEDGFGNAFLPEPKGKVVDQPAAVFIIEMARRFPGEITLVPLGPLTNIGLALRLEPKLPELIKEVVLMGGAVTVPGNVSPFAEANIHDDPHAADVVMGAGFNLTIIGLDVTAKTVMTNDHFDALFTADNPAVHMIEKITPHYRDFYDKVTGLGGGVHTHDPSTIAYILRPELYETRQAPVYVETVGRSRGQTTADWNRRWGEERKAVEICVDVDAEGVLALVHERLTAKM